MNTKNYEELLKTESWTVEDYMKLYDMVIALADDCDGFGLFEEIGEEEILKAKWLEVIFDCLDDVPKRRMEHVLEYADPEMEEMVQEQFDEMYENF